MGKFLEPWFTPTNIMNSDKTLNILLIAMTMFLLLYATGAGGEVVSLLQQQMNIVYLLFMFAFAYIAMGMVPRIYAGFGTMSNLKKGIILGAIVGGVMVLSASLQMATPLASTLSSSEILALFYIAFIVPLAEEKFFGNSLPYILDKSIKNMWVTMAVSSLIFGTFHLFAYGANWSYIFVAVAFRFITLFGNTMLQTSAFGITIHYINNIVTVAKKLMLM